jgi:glycosyltransferase involved in cell wall biosynthesis
MISVIIPAMNAADTLPAVFQSIFDAAMDGVVSEVILCDGGSTDATREIAEAAGAMVIEAGGGQELLAGAEAARKPWLLLLHADAILEKGWEEEATAFMARGEMRAAAFRIRLSKEGKPSAFNEALRGIKARAFRARRSCPALLIPGKLFEAAGDATAAAPVYESELMHRLGPKRLVKLNSSVLVTKH